MRLRAAVVCLFVFALGAFAQGDRGTITGVISDPAGAVVANAAIEARNQATGVVSQAASTATGNYTLAQLPTGTYEINVTVGGFKKYTRTGLTVQALQTLRVDILLEIGASTESVTVTEAAPLLKTETGDVSHNVTTNKVNDLPVGTLGAIRNPLTVSQLIPGTNVVSGSTLRISGTPVTRNRSASTAWMPPIAWVCPRTRSGNRAWTRSRRSPCKPVTMPLNSARLAAPCSTSP